MSNLIKPGQTLPASLAPAVERAAEFVRESVPENTRRAYAADWAVFSEWCRQKRVAALPADPRVVAAFVADEAQRLRPASIRRRLASIAKMHKVSGHPSPTTMEPVPSTVKGIERTHGVSVKAKAPAILAAVEKMVATQRTDTFDGLRNRALLLVGFAGAFRRSEIVGLTCDDLKWTDEGVVITLRRSKTDQRGEGKQKAIPYVPGGSCAAMALKAWMTAAKITRGPVFRPLDRNGAPKARHMVPQSVALIVKGAARAAGLDPAIYSGHSLRAGHVTEARSRGVADSQTMATTGHKRVETLDMYDRRENVFQKTSAGEILKPR
jgi:site-specific recombinase XerD